MAMNKRERRLAWVTGVLASVAVAWLLLSWVWSPLTTLRDQRESLQGEVEQKDRQVQSARKAEERLVDYRRRALPSDPVLARDLYKNWLLESVHAAGLQDASVVPGVVGRYRGGIYVTLPFTISARGTLDQLTEFLYRFYSKDYLQQIRSLTVTPSEGSRNLGLNISIEALSLPDADHADRLPDDLAPRLAGASQADYAAIGKRNLFAPYQSPAADRPPPQTAPPFDPSKFAVITSITASDDHWVLSLHARTTGEMFYLREGDTFQIGPVQGKVLQIYPRAADIELNGERRLVPLGNSLQDAQKPAGKGQTS